MALITVDYGAYEAAAGPEIDLSELMRTSEFMCFTENAFYWHSSGTNSINSIGWAGTMTCDKATRVGGTSVITINKPCVLYDVYNLAVTVTEKQAGEVVPFTNHHIYYFLDM